MVRSLLLGLLLLTACSKGPHGDLPYISQARSIAAEWALLNEQAAGNRLTPDYTKTMRQSFREQLQTVSKSLSQPDSRYALEIQAVLAQPDDAPPEELRAHAAKLKQIEDGLESA
jgi:hypothetical protein